MKFTCDEVEEILDMGAYRKPPPGLRFLAKRIPSLGRKLNTIENQRRKLKHFVAEKLNTSTC